jgi:hypothetical protein
VARGLGEGEGHCGYPTNSASATGKFGKAKSGLTGRAQKKPPAVQVVESVLVLAPKEGVTLEGILLAYLIAYYVSQ